MKVPCALLLFFKVCSLIFLCLLLFTPPIYKVSYPVQNCPQEQYCRFHNDPIQLPLIVFKNVSLSKSSYNRFIAQPINQFYSPHTNVQAIGLYRIQLPLVGTHVSKLLPLHSWFTQEGTTII